MKHLNLLSSLMTLLGTLAFQIICFANSLPERGLIIREIEQDGQTHIKLRASAFEKDGEAKFPIKTLDRNSFQIEINELKIGNPNISLTTFNNTRRTNSRAMIWIYDATGVKSFKGLTRDLRTMVAQEFSDFQPDFLSVLGVAAGRTIERILLTPNQQENVLALRRSLIADPTGLHPSSFSSEPALCIAAKKFEGWQKRGLNSFDQKTLILMGGPSPTDSTVQKETVDCIKSLKEMKINIQQIVFSKQERRTHPLWSDDQEVLSYGSVYRVVDLSGASRAIQNIKASLESEYIISAQIPYENKENIQNLQLLASYHDTSFESNSVPLKTIIFPSATEKLSNTNPTQPQHPEKFTTLTSHSVFVLDAWLEWLSIAVFTGCIVTILHTKRMNTGITEVSDHSEIDDTSHGPLLIVLNGKDKGRKYRIRQCSTLLGKGWSCDIRLQPLGVKNKHVRLEIQGDKAVLQDLSEGQLVVNGRSVRAIRVIGHGSVIRIGELHLLFQCGES